MYYRSISKVLGKYLLFLALALCAPLLVSIHFEFFAGSASHPQPHSAQAFITSIGACLFLSFVFKKLGRDANKLYRREAIALAVIIWFVTAFIAAMPFYFSKTLENPIDAYFEAISGLTTTGASIMHPKQYDEKTGEEIPIVTQISKKPEVQRTFYGTIKPVRDPQTNAIIYSGIDAVSKGILFWRSLIQWFGGGGIIILFISILPAFGVGGKVLFQSEVTGPIKDSLTPRIKETCSLIWKLYLSFTAAEIVLLMLTNKAMPLFDAACITFSTISTGGFTVHNDSIGFYNNFNTEFIILIFMVVGSINFTLYFYCLKGKLHRLYQPEFLLYFVILLSLAIFISFKLIGFDKELLIPGPEGHYTTKEAFRYGFFHLISIQTSTGFSTANFDVWPFSTQILLLIAMFIGGMAGSTAGGMKIARHYMMFRITANHVESIFRPETVRTIKMNNIEIPRHAIMTVLCFFAIVLVFLILGTILLVLDGLDPETSVSTIACMMNNIGATFRLGGPTNSFAFLSPFSKIVSALWMVLGRLEYFVVLIMLIPAFWRRK